MTIEKYTKKVLPYKCVHCRILLLNPHNISILSMGHLAWHTLWQKYLMELINLCLFVSRYGILSTISPKWSSSRCGYRSIEAWSLFLFTKYLWHILLLFTLCDMDGSRQIFRGEKIATVVKWSENKKYFTSIFSFSKHVVVDDDDGRFSLTVHETTKISRCISLWHRSIYKIRVDSVYPYSFQSIEFITYTTQRQYIFSGENIRRIICRVICWTMQKMSKNKVPLLTFYKILNVVYTSSLFSSAYSFSVSLESETVYYMIWFNQNGVAQRSHVL